MLLRPHPADPQHERPPVGWEGGGGCCLVGSCLHSRAAATPIRAGRRISQQRQLAGPASAGAVLPCVRQPLQLLPSLQSSQPLKPLQPLQML